MPVSACRVLSEDELSPNGGRSRDEGFVLEASFGLGSGRGAGAYAQRLQAFDFGRDDSNLDLLRFHGALGRRLHRNLLVGVDYYNLQPRGFVREVEGVKRHFAWNWRFKPAKLPPRSSRSASTAVVTGARCKVPSS